MPCLGARRVAQKANARQGMALRHNAEKPKYNVFATMHRFNIIAFLLPLGAFAQPEFTIQDLGTLPNMPACIGTAISQSGQVTGYCNPAGGSVFNNTATRAFLYSNGVLKDLGATSKPTVPTGVNDSGVVVGAFFNISLVTGVSTSPFIYQNGAIQKFTGIPAESAPFGLNNAGQSAATDILAGGTNLFLSSQAFEITTAGTSTGLPPSSGSLAVAFGISSANDWVAGASVTAANSDITSIKPTLWHSGSPQELPLAPGFNYALATAVNDSGVAAGMGVTFNFVALLDPRAAGHALLFKDGAVTDLGVLPGDKSSAAEGINNAGSVVGFSSSAVPDIALTLGPLIEAVSTTQHAFLYSNGTLYDLTRQLVNASGWQLSSANAINDAGQIAGTGIFQQQQHAFLLTPVTGPQIDDVVGAGLHLPAVKSLSANGLFTIFGTGFAEASFTRNVSGSDLINNALPTNLGNICVQGGNARWGLIYVSAKQINAVADPLSISGTVPVSVIANCGLPNEISSAPFDVAVAAETPQFFFVDDPQGQNEVVAVEALSGARVGPVGLIPGGDPFTPARAGDILTVYGTGWGATTPAAVAGSLAPAAATLTGAYTLKIGDQTAEVSYAGLSPTFAGLYQINFTVPSGLTPGLQKIVLTVDGVETPPGAFLAVQ
jgi:uncharacterized protein (TIGR03437 family)